MSEVQVIGVRTDGKKFTDTIREDTTVLNINDVREIDLTAVSACLQLRTFKLFSSYGLSKIDLSPLAGCDIKKIYIEKTQIAEIDLSPLESMKGLEELYITISRLSSVDLSPLANCTALKGIWLNNNVLNNLDLEPLKKLEKLETICLQNNMLESIDLNPLARCSNLRMIKLSANKISSIDLTPLANCQHLRDVHLDFNRLQSIDLSPLSKNSEIMYLLLNDNQLVEDKVDFGSLKHNEKFLKTTLENTAFHKASKDIKDIKPTIYESLKEKIG